ncbi:MAG: DpnII family type II restriction endonuclease, partial [Candidatus Caccosoma sp.]|nr:DpnII family type II restriction endonuclease [Candidatus Caccosoma sp.]
MKRNFNEWLSTMKDCIASWNYYSDLEKAYRNVESIKVELNILNSLIGSKNIEKEFVSILNDYPKTLKVIPILLAKREKEMKIVDVNGEHLFNFKNPNYSIDEYVSFMRKTGLFDLLENHIINNLFDYVTGVEVGLDSNGRKNRGGDAMEDLVEAYLVKYGLVKGKTYF